LRFGNTNTSYMIQLIIKMKLNDLPSNHLLDNIPEIKLLLKTILYGNDMATPKHNVNCQEPLSSSC